MTELLTPTNLDIAFPLGDTFTLARVVDTAGVAIDITTALAVLVAKEDSEDTEAEAVILLSSRKPTEIDFTDPTNGKLSAKFQSFQTADLDPSCYPYDLRVYRRDVELTAAEVGTVAVTAGSKTIVGTGTKFALLHENDLVLLNSGPHPENNVPVRIVKVTDDTHVDVDWTAWTPDAAVTIRAWIADVKTIVYGELTLSRK